MRHAARVFLAFSFLHGALYGPFLLAGRHLAPHDALHISLPAFLSPRTAWTPLLFGGYPALADPQGQGLYPVAALFPRTPGGFDAFVLSGYVLASALAYALAFRLTRSVVASLVAGTTYGASGFLTGHMMHTAMVHAAAWLPLVVLAAVELRRRRTSAAIALAAAAIALAALAGHPQPFVATLYLAIACAVFEGGARGAAAGAAAFTAAAALGTAAAGASLVPALELASRSIRNAPGLELFATWALAPRHLPALLVPFAFGGPEHALAEGFTFTEHAGYVGWLPLLLGVVALGGERRREAAFWVAVAGASVALALGAATPLGRAAALLPGIAYFRSPGRHLMELALAASVLGALGISRIEQMPPARALRAAGRAGAAVLLAAALLLAPTAGSCPPRAVASALLLSLSSAAALAWWSRDRRPVATATLLLVLVLDLGHVARVSALQGHEVSSSDLVMPRSLEGQRRELLARHARLMPLRGAAQPGEAAPPNRSMLWGVPSASGYNPLRPELYARLMGRAVAGGVPPRALSRADRTLDLLGAARLLVPRAVVEGTPGHERQGIGWSDEELGIVLGGCGGAPGARAVSLSVPGVPARELAIVTSLSCAAGVAQDAPVLRLQVRGEGGQSEELVLRAGIETAEWAIDRADVAPVARHARARLFHDVGGVDAAGSPFAGHDYLAVLPVGVGRVTHLQLTHAAPGVMVTVARITLVGRSGAYAVAREADLLRPPRWKEMERLEQTAVYENATVLPRAWLVPEAVVLADDLAVRAIRTSRLPDGRAFDPRRTALLEEPLQLPDAATGGSATILDDAGVALRVRTVAPQAALLVLGDLHYPGWEASVDGEPARILRANVAFRAVPVPGGSHVVTFRYRPASHRMGAGLAALGVAGIALLAAAGGGPAPGARATGLSAVDRGATTS